MKSALPNDMLPSPNYMVPLPNDKLQLPNDKLPSPNDMVPLPNDKLQSSSDKLPSPNDMVPLPNDKLPSPNDKLPSLNDMVLLPTDKPQSPNDKLPSPNDMVPLPNDKLQSPNDKVPLPNDKIPSRNDRVPLPNDKLQSPNDKAYRKAFWEHAGNGDNGIRGITPRDSSPGESSFASPVSFIQPRHKNRTTYVQRWKVLRDRNKNLPQLDFNAKASGAPKKFQGPGSFSRSYTYDSMKLPSISTCSIVTGVSGKSVHSDGYRRRDLTDKRNLQDQHSESYTDLSTQREYLAIALSKSLQNLAQDDSVSQKEETKSLKGNNSHRYESISYKKHLLKRQKIVESTDKTKRSKGAPIKVKAEKDQFPKLTDKEFVFVRNHTKLSPALLNNDKQDKAEEHYKKANKKSAGSVNHPSSPLTEDFTNRSDTFTVTPDDVTIHSPFTHTSSNITNLQYPINMHTPFLYETV